VLYGLTKNLTTHNWFTIQVHEFAAIARDAWKASGVLKKLRQIFASPTALAKEPE